MSQKGRSMNFSLELIGGRMRVGVGHEVERARPGGWNVSRLRRYDGLYVTMVLKMTELMTL